MTEDDASFSSVIIAGACVGYANGLSLINDQAEGTRYGIVDMSTDNANSIVATEVDGLISLISHTCGQDVALGFAALTLRRHFIFRWLPVKFAVAGHPERSFLAGCACQSRHSSPVASSCCTSIGCAPSSTSAALP